MAPETRLKKRIDSMRSCVEIAKYLDESPRHQIPMSRGASEADIQETKDRYLYSRKMIAHMLNAIVFEIGIKVIWELDNNEECRFTHNVSSLFGELTERSQRELKEIYDKKSAFLAGLGGTDKKGQPVRIGDLTQFQSLQEALIANEDTMKNFKYDGVFDGKSSTMGSIMWDNEQDLLLTLPPLQNVRFPEALYYYMRDRLREAKPT